VTSPIFDQKNNSRYDPDKGGSLRYIMEDYTRYMRLLVFLVKAVGRLVDAGRELSHFAGHTDRISLLEEVLNDINRSKFQRTMVQQWQDKKPIGQLLIQDAIIRFDKVPIVTPNGDVLLNEISFEIRPTMNCLIFGPNGCGKSSLFRILGGLWPIYDGIVTRPDSKNLFYVPQKPYHSLGTLREQVSYPDTPDQVRMKNVSDDDLLNLLKIVKLEYVLQREGGWDAIADWADVLSGGEKQRIAMARLFYHKPQFAILDECTSAVSVDVEGEMYTYCKSTGITLCTISHRQTLFKYHNYILKFDGKGNYEFKALKPEDYPKV